MFQSKFEHVVEENKKLQKIIADLKSVKENLDKLDKIQAIILFATLYVLSYFYYRFIQKYKR